MAWRTFMTWWRSQGRVGKAAVVVILAFFLAWPSCGVTYLLFREFNETAPSTTAVERERESGAEDAHTMGHGPTPKPTFTPRPTDRPAVTHTPRPVATRTPLPSATQMSSVGAPDRVRAIVLRVIDAYTIEVELGGERHKVRYIGIDCPEMGDSEGDEERLAQDSGEANRSLVEGKTVYLEKDKSETDAHGRLLRYVWAGGVMVNAELVHLGHAKVTEYPTDVRYRDLFLRLEGDAREAGRGLWGRQVVAMVAPGAEATATSLVAAQSAAAVGPSATLPPTSALLPSVVATRTQVPLSQPTATPIPTAALAPTETPLPTATPEEPTPPPTASPEPTAPPTLLPGTGDVRIKHVHYDGEKGRQEPDEYCEIVNQGSAAVNLKDWRLNAGAKGQDFLFPDFSLGPGQTCRVYTNEHHPESGGLSFGRKSALWKNSGDCGYLYDAGGKKVSEYCY